MRRQITLFLLALMLIGSLGLVPGMQSSIAGVLESDSSVDQHLGFPTIYEDLPDNGYPPLSDQARITLENNFTIAAEGTHASDSIDEFAETLTSDSGLDPDSDTSGSPSYEEWDFSETIGTDVLYYPDTLTDTAYWGDDEGELGEIYGDYTSTETYDNPSGYPTDSSVYYAKDSSGITRTAWVEVRVKVPSAVEQIDLHIYYKVITGNSPTVENLEIYNHTAGDYDVLVDWPQGGSDWVWKNTTISDTEYWSAGYIDVRVYAQSSSSSDAYALLDYVAPFMMTSDGYTENFVDVSDWSTYSVESGDTISTDGDVGDLETHSTSDNNYNGMTSDIATLDATGCFVEVRAKINTTTGYDWSVIYLDMGNSPSSDYIYDTFVLTTSYQTFRWYTGDMLTAGSYDVTAVECIAFLHRIDNGAQVKIDKDYLRVGSVMGWSHDGSTTEALSSDADSEITYSSSSDGDWLTLNATADAGYSSGNQYPTFFFLYDTTATAMDIELDYYSWMEIKFNLTMVSTAIYFDPVVEGYRMNALGVPSAGDSQTVRYNIKERTAASAASPPRLWIYAFMNAEGDSFELDIDYVRFYGFNNWTYVTGATNNMVTGVAYYDSSEEAVVMEKTLDGSNDYFYLKTRNTSIDYWHNDMVALLTVKASANTSLSIRFDYHDNTERLSSMYYLYDEYQTIAVPLTTAATSELNWFRILFNDWSDASPSGSRSLYIKNNVTVRPSWYDASAESGTYGESFADVSDWTWLSGEVFTSDGDIGIKPHNGDAAYDYEQTNGPSISGGSYIETRHRVNASGGSYGYRVYVATLDDYGGTTLRVISVAPTTTWITTKVYVSQDIESLKIGWAANLVVQLEIDYLRIAPATQMGFELDMAQVDYDVENMDTFYSDGDNQHFIGTAASSSYAYWVVPNLKQSDYPFCEFRWKADIGHDTHIRFTDEDGNIDNHYLTETGDWVTSRINVAARMDGSGDYISAVYFKDGKDNDQEFWLDYIKFYSIANFTVTQGSTETDDIAYVDGGKLYVEVDGTPEYIGFQHDPALSVAVATSNVWNVTLASPLAGDYIQFNVGGWETHYFSDTRGSFAGTGTLTDLAMYFYNDETISAIEFWEDATAPDVLASSVSPPEPDDDESITISTLVNDWTDVYKVWINALSYPAGFSDTDYALTEVQDDFWIYEFSTLDAGYYAFQVLAFDGAQNSTLTDAESVLDFTVRDKILDVTNPLLTVGGSTVQLSGDINMLATYTVYENDVQVATGSITQTPSYSITWTRATGTTAADVSVGVKFVNGSMVDWANGTYSKSLQTNYVVEDWWLRLQLGTENYIEGYVRTSWENATVKVYDNGTLQLTVTESEGGVFFYWWMSGTQGVHNIVLNITSGSTTLTRSRPYIVPDWATTALAVKWDLWTFQDNYTMIQLESNWRNCSYTVYLNESSIATSANDPVILNFTRSINIGEYNLTIYADGGSQTYTISNIRYIVTEEGVSYDYSSVSGGFTNVEGDTYEGDNVTNIHYENPPGIFISEEIAVTLAIGTPIALFLVFLILRTWGNNIRLKIEEWLQK